MLEKISSPITNHASPSELASRHVPWAAAQSLGK